MIAFRWIIPAALITFAVVYAALHDNAGTWSVAGIVSRVLFVLCLALVAGVVHFAAAEWREW